MQKRSVMLIDPMPSSPTDDFEGVLTQCIEFMCGLTVDSITMEGEQYKVYLSTTGYDKKSVKETLLDTDYIQNCDIVV